MKVRIPTQEFPDIVRRALRYRSGGTGLATRDECMRHFVEYGHSLDDDMVIEYEAEVERRQVEKERGAAAREVQG